MADLAELRKFLPTAVGDRLARLEDARQAAFAAARAAHDRTRAAEDKVAAMRAEVERLRSGPSGSYQPTASIDVSHGRSASEMADDLEADLDAAMAEAARLAAIRDAADAAASTLASHHEAAKKAATNAARCVRAQLAQVQEVVSDLPKRPTQKQAKAAEARIDEIERQARAIVTVAAVREIRLSEAEAALSDLRLKRRQIAAAPLPAAEAKQTATEFLDRAAAIGMPNLGPLVEIGAAPEWRQPHDTRSNMSPEQHFGLCIAASVHRDALEQLWHAQIDEIADDEAAMPIAEKPKRIAEIDARLKRAQFNLVAAHDREIGDLQYPSGVTGAGLLLAEIAEEAE